MTEPWSPEAWAPTGIAPQPVYKKVSDRTFRTRADFIMRVAQLVHDVVDEVGPTTIRAIYYRAVMTQLVESGPGYEEIRKAVADGRDTGLVPWNYIIDRGRDLIRPLYHQQLHEELQRLLENYSADLGAGQRFRIEVWLEQAALEGVVWPVCEEFGVPLMVCGGFISHGALWEGAERQRHYASNLGQHGIILVLSDFDPSGVTMADFIKRRLESLSDQHVFVQRVGLTRAQADAHGLIGRALKVGRDDKADDSRAASFIDEHGHLAFELDGLPAAVLQQILRSAIVSYIDEQALADARAEADVERRRLKELIKLGEEEEIL